MTACAWLDALSSWPVALVAVAAIAAAAWMVGKFFDSV